MKKFLYSIVLVGFLFGCASDGTNKVSPDQLMAATCSSYTEALNIATAFYNAMNESQRQVIYGAVTTIGPNCTSWGNGDVVVTVDLVTSLQNTLRNMLVVTGSFEQ